MTNRILLIAILLFTLAASNPNPREQYYRGVYDICLYYGYKAGHTKPVVIEACQAYVAAWVKAKRYEKASDEWQWPMKIKESGG